MHALRAYVLHWGFPLAIILGIMAERCPGPSSARHLAISPIATPTNARMMARFSEARNVMTTGIRSSL